MNKIDFEVVKLDNDPMADAYLPVFVYGTLRRGGGNHGWLLDGQTVREARAVLTGARMWDYGGFPFVTLSADPDDVVVGELMWIPVDRYQAVLRRLDGLEGYRGPGRQNLYDRVLATVPAGDADVRCWVYIAGDAERVTGLPRVQSGDWFAK